MEKKIFYLLFMGSTLFSLIACQPVTHKEKERTIKTPEKVTPKAWSTQDAVKAAEAKFAEYLPKILASHDAALDIQESHTGDFTGDGIDDVAIYFNLSPKDGGNANMGQGLALYKNTGTSIQVLAGFDPDYLFTFKGITEGKIHIEQLEYASEDGHCCPSIKTERVLNINGNTVQAVDENRQ